MDSGHLVLSCLRGNSLRFITGLFLLFGLFSSPSYAFDQFKNEQDAQQHCAGDTVVWLNLRSGSVHLKGQQWYGRTQVGTYVCKSELGKKIDKVAKAERNDMSGWTKVLADETKTVYASSSVLEKNGDAVTILSMVDLKRPAKLSDGKEFLSWETQYEFNCKTEQSRIIAASMYSENMGGGEVTGSFVHDSPSWEPIPVGSNGEILWKSACGKR